MRVKIFFYRKSICSLLITAVDNIEYKNIQLHVTVCSKLLSIAVNVQLDK